MASTLGPRISVRHHRQENGIAARLRQSRGRQTSLFDQSLNTSKQLLQARLSARSRRTSTGERRSSFSIEPRHLENTRHSSADRDNLKDLRSKLRPPSDSPRFHASSSARSFVTTSNARPSPSRIALFPEYS